jgi:hypothetical protein
MTKEELDTMTDVLRWSLDLQERIRRRCLIGELVDGNTDTSDLACEVEQFKRVARALSWKGQ